MKRTRYTFCISGIASLLLLTAFTFHIYLLIPLSDPQESLESHICHRNSYPPRYNLSSDQVTILMNGFSESRIPLLEQHAQVYSASTIVNSIYILWGNSSTSDQVLLNVNLESFGAPIYIIRNPSSSLNYRFLPRSFITTRAVLICDDDVSVDPKTVRLAFQVWNENPDRIIGLFPRSHIYDIRTRSWIYTKHVDRYSMMLTKFMILATEFLYMYTCQMPRGVKEYVDDAMNCEDIAMNFLVSNLSSKGPLLVEGSPRDWGDPRNQKNAGLVGEALSARTGHRKNRGDCIGAFHRIWDAMPLRYTYFKAVSDVREQAMCEDSSGKLVECDRIGVES